MKAAKPKTFLVETNRSSRSTLRNCSRLRAGGYDATRLPNQPTAIIVRDPLGRPWCQTRVALADLANTQSASVVVMSGQTGRVFQLNRRGNRPAHWIIR